MHFSLSQATTNDAMTSLNSEPASDYLQTLLDFSQTGICVLSPILNEQRELTDFRFKAINRKVAGLVNQVPDTMRNSPVSDWFASYRDTESFWSFKDAYETGQPKRFETNYNVDGFDVWFDIQCTRQGEDLLVTFSDFTSLKQAQQAIEWQSAQNRKQAELLNGILNSSDSGIMAFEAIRDHKDDSKIVDFRFLMANQASETIIGRPVKQMIGRTLLRVFPGNVESGLFDGYVHTTLTGEPFRTETHYNYDGLDFFLTISAQKLGDGFVVTFNDISVFRRMQQQLENSVADLQRSNESLQQFAYVASHDLQEPLRKIQAFGDMLKLTYAERLGDGADMVGRMQTAAGRMSGLIRDLLAYSRLATQNEPMRPIALSEVMQQVLENLELTVQETGALIQVSQLPTLTGDEFQLEQLFQNILSNALKFRQETLQPVITLTTRTIAYDQLPPDVKPLRRAAIYHAISVTDNGIGFDERYRERIFQVFQRLHGKQQYAGTGIGLAIVQRVADNHGGAVEAHGRLGHGASFTVYLPG